MKICHFTNTFLPHVGGVARAVQTLLEDQRRARQRVLVVAPEFESGKVAATIERSVVRTPALTNFNASEFSVSLPFGTAFAERLAGFRADIIHAHHPFLLGDSALREAASRQVPVVFTHHTLYEHYTHYLPIESEAAGEFAAEVATRFANRCAAVLAPSQSVKELICSRGVTVPVHVMPTGIDTRKLATGRGERARQRWRLPARALVLGHLGRLAAEKNLDYLADALVRTLRREPRAHVLIVGDGPARANMEATFRSAGVAARVTFSGKLTGAPLRDACAAMDVFAFASLSETQGLVLAEAMATGAPVVALDAPGVRDVVRDRHNGRLLPAAAPAETFARALTAVLQRPALLRAWSAQALATARELDRRHTSARLLALYADVIAHHRSTHPQEASATGRLRPVIDRIVTEGQIIADKAGALIAAVTGQTPSLNPAA